MYDTSLDKSREPRRIVPCAFRGLRPYQSVGDSDQSATIFSKAQKWHVLETDNQNAKMKIYQLQFKKKLRFIKILIKDSSGCSVPCGVTTRVHGVLLS